jgi:selenide,water dikinase
VAAMSTLNAAAAAALEELEEKPEARKPIHAVTDVTGFSFLGHAREMALGDPEHGLEPVSFEIDHASFSYFPGAVEAAREGHLSGGLRNNRAFVGECARFESSVLAEYQDLLFDPQTSGGFLVAIAPDHADSALAAFRRRGVHAYRVGRVLPKTSPLIRVL